MVISREKLFQQQKFYMVGIIKETWGESVNRVAALSVEEICKHFGNVSIPYITTTL